MMKDGDTRTFEGKGLFSSTRFELVKLAPDMILAYYKNGKLVKKFPVSGTAIKLNGKKLDLKYSGDAFGGPAFMTVDCKQLTNDQLREMMLEIRGK